MFFSLVNAFSAGSLLVLGIVLSCLRVSRQTEWSPFRTARMYTVLACVILVFAYVREALQGPTEGPITIIVWYCISVLQALLFTGTCVAFVAPGLPQRRLVMVELLLALAVLIVEVVMLVTRVPHFTSFVGPVNAGLYALQLVDCTLYFMRTYRRSIERLETVYEDEYEGRLSWVKRLFASALFVGVLSMAIMALYTTALVIGFKLIVVLVYSAIVISFGNYYYTTLFVVKASKVKTTADRSLTPVYSLSPEAEAEVRDRLQAWVQARGYVKADLSVDEIVQELALSRESFNAYFKLTLHTQFRSWRRELRLSEAVRLLNESPAIPIPELMEAVGYNDRSNFHKDFQRYTGQSLSDYRHQL